MIEEMENALFNAEDATFDKAKAQALVAAYEDFYKEHPDDPKSAEFLFRAGDLSKGLREANKAVALYKIVNEDFPEYEKSPLALFLQGFIYENDLGDYANAKVIYESFLEKYPDHEMAKDAKFSLQNLGKSPEELLKEFQLKEGNN